MNAGQIGQIGQIGPGSTRMAEPTRAVVHAFTADHPALPGTVRARIEKLIEGDTAALVYAQDWADFNKRIGQLAGLNAALGICGEIEKKLRGHD